MTQEDHDAIERERAALLETFERTLALGGYGPDRYVTWNALVNRDVVTLFKGCDWLGPEEIATAYVSRVARRAYLMVNPHAAWRNAGNLIHYALRLGLVAEAADPARGRGWRLVHDEVQWVVEGEGARRHARQIRGLPPEEQAAEDRRQARLAKLAATLDRKARLAADGKIAQAVEEILRYDPATVVPEAWARRGYVQAWLPGTRLDAAAAVVRDAHHAAAMDRPTLKAWLSDLAMEGAVAVLRPRQRQAKQAALPETAEIPADDADALEALL